jgi:hypothetical protein
MKRGRAGTMTHDYKRHGTTTLFAALDVLEGEVIGQCMKRHPARRSPVARVVAFQIPRSISWGEKNHGLRFEGILKIEFARKSPSNAQKPANSIT